MRSLHFTDTYLPRRDGVVTSVRTLTAALTELGHEAVTVVPGHREQPDATGLLRLPAVPCGIADLRMAPWLLRERWAAGALARIAAESPDLIHVHTPGPGGLLGVLASRVLGVPLVQTYHTDLHAYAEAYRVPAVALSAGLRLYAHRLGLPRPSVPSPVTGPGRRAVAAARRHATVDATNRLLLRDAGAVIVPTRAVLARLDLPVDADRITVIPTGVHPPDAGPGAGARFRRAHGIGAGERVVLYVGRVNREKGVDRLIEAFALLAAGRPDARLVLVGAVYEDRWLNRLLARAGVGGRVVLAGQQPSTEVAAAYQAADVFAFPSVTDTQALVLLEAAHSRLPVVMVDQVLHQQGLLNDAALLTGPDAADLAGGIGALLDDPARARHLADRAAMRAADYTADGYARAVLAVYQGAMRVAPVQAVH
ncbi:glycosyltransferase [Actinoplanes sp. NPDC051861]|uniref:glycosyltransferase n=1 Tax=Actinoplanes sp. NPDC051861 TaxID=3155170 RepID=UPI003429AF89